MLKLIIALLIVNTSFAGEGIDLKLSNHLNNLQDFEYLLEKDYYVSMNLMGNDRVIKNEVELKDCQLTLKTLSDDKLVHRDIINLSKYFVWRKPARFKGSFALTFGLKQLFLERAFLYFKDRKSRRVTFKIFKKYVRICHKRIVKKYFKKEEPAFRSEFIGGIPQGITETDGRVQTIEQGNEVALLTGEQSFVERAKIVKEAQNTIYAQQLFWRGDVAGIYLGNLLMQRKAEGLDVRVMTSGMFNVFSNHELAMDMKNSAILLKNMLAAGIPVFGMGCKGFLLDEIRGGDLLRFLKPSHVKAWVVDGNESISGGMNISHRYFRLGSRGLWRDQDIGIRGPINLDFHEAFLRDFADRELHYNTYKNNHKCFNKFDPILEKEKYVKFKKENTIQYIKAKKEEEKTEQALINEHIELLLQGLGTDGKTKLREIKFSKPDALRVVVARPDENEDYILKAHLDLVNNAQKEILIANVFSLFIPEFKLALRKAAARGVKIKILTNEPYVNSGIPMMNVLGRYYYLDLISNHKKLDESLDPTLEFDPTLVEIHEWLGKKPGTDKQTQGVMHSKFMLVDKTIGVVGSFNMDYASLVNPEQIVIYESDELGAELEELFYMDMRYAKKLTVEEIKSFRKPKGSRFLLFLAMLVEKRL